MSALRRLVLLGARAATRAAPNGASSPAAAALDAASSAAAAAARGGATSISGVRSLAVLAARGPAVASASSAPAAGCRCGCAACAACACVPSAPSAARAYSHCSCPTLGDGSTPRKVVFEFDPSEVDRFIALADEIEDAFPDLIVEGNPEADGRPGSFEVVTDDGRPLFSRLECARWPNTSELLLKIGGALEAAAEAAAAAAPAATDGAACKA
jgi:selT/selW/selH-like putative selenoprotein